MWGGEGGRGVVRDEELVSLVLRIRVEVSSNGLYVSHLFERWKDMNELKRGRDDSGIPFRVLVDRSSSHVVGVCEGVCEDVCEDG